MNDIEIAVSISQEMDALEENLFEGREIGEVITIADGAGSLMYAKTNDNILIPFFKTMNKCNGVDTKTIV